MSKARIPLLLAFLVVPSGAGCASDTGNEGSLLECGTGTHQVSGRCAPDQPLTCGAGTHEADGRCLPDAGPSCGAGTHQQGEQCLPDTAGLTCGAGTHQENGRCLPDAGGLTCGAGTHEAGGQCLPDAAGLTCGAGTHEAGGQCLPDASPSCGAGTHEEGGRCVPDPVQIEPHRASCRGSLLEGGAPQDEGGEIVDDSIFRDGIGWWDTRMLTSKGHFGEPDCGDYFITDIATRAGALEIYDAAQPTIRAYDFVGPSGRCYRFRHFFFLCHNNPCNGGAYDRNPVAENPHVLRPEERANTTRGVWDVYTE